MCAPHNGIAPTMSRRSIIAQLLYPKRQQKEIAQINNTARSEMRMPAGCPTSSIGTSVTGYICPPLWVPSAVEEGDVMSAFTYIHFFLNGCSLKEECCEDGSAQDRQTVRTYDDVSAGGTLSQM